MAGCQCRHGRHAASRISRPAAVATGAAVATACGSSRSLEQLPSANKAAGWKEEAEVAADEGGVHQAGRVGQGAVWCRGQAKPCLVPLGPGAPSTGQTGRAVEKQEILCHNSWQSQTFFQCHNFSPPIPAAPPSSASAWQEYHPNMVSTKKAKAPCKVDVRE